MMNMSYFKIIVIISMTLISGCSTLGKVEDRGAKAIADSVKKYCIGTTEDYRKNFRSKINENLGDIAEIKVNCK